MREEGENGAGISSAAAFGEGERGSTKAGFRLSGGEAGCDAAGVSALNGVWLVGGFFASMKRGLLRNGVLVLPGVERPGGIGRAHAFGVACIPVFLGAARGIARGAGVLGTSCCRFGGEEGIASDCRPNFSSSVVFPPERRLRLLLSRTGAKSASNSASRTPGVSGSHGGVLSIASSITSFPPLPRTAASLLMSPSSESSIVSLCRRGGITL